MKKTILSLVVILASVTASAHIPSVVKKVAADTKLTDTRTIVKEVTNDDGNPCMPEGKSYIVEVQVKQAVFNQETSKVVYSWETAKTISVDQAGRVSEVCAE